MAQPGTTRNSPICAAPQRKVGGQALATHVLRAPAEDLPFEDGTFDAVVSTLVLCGVDDQLPALRELRRVLRPGARFLFLEHLRSDDPRLLPKAPKFVGPAIMGSATTPACRSRRR